MNNQYEKLLSKLQNADEKERDWLMMEFSLQNLTDILRQAVWAAAIPHWFDHAFLNAVLGFELKDSDFQALTELSFIESFPERRFNVHERSRNLLLQYLWKHNKVRFQKLSKHAASYCKKQDQNVTHWRVETLYHALLADLKNATWEFEKQTNDWFNSFQYEKVESLTQPILEAVNNGFIRSESQADALRYQGLVDTSYSRYDAAQTCLKQALSIYQKIKNRLHEANCNYRLGDIYLQLNDLNTAITFYQVALPLYRKMQSFTGQAHCLSGLGNVDLELAEYESARQHYTEALPLYKKEQQSLGQVNCLSGLADVDLALADYESAQQRYTEALPLYQASQNRLGQANCLMGLGNVDFALADYESARQRYQQITNLYAEIGSKHNQARSVSGLALTYGKEKQFMQALAAYQQAIETYPDEAGFYQNRASLYMQMEDYEKAEADIKHAEMMGRNPAFTLLRKAELALWQQQTLQAIEFSQQALAQRPADGNFRAFYALTLLANGQTEQGNSEMQQALTTIYQPHDFTNLLEDLDKLIRIYGNRADFTNMRELIVKHPQFKTL